MSDFKTVKVASVEVKTGGGDNGKREWTKFTLVDGNGEKASTFDTKIGKFLQDHIGKQVDVTTEQDGKFTNLLSAVEHVEAQQASASGGGYARDPDTEMRIAREACLKVAAQVVPAAQTTRETVDHVLTVANTLVRWVYSGDKPALAAAISPSHDSAPFDPDEVPF